MAMWINYGKPGPPPPFRPTYTQMRSQRQHRTHRQILGNGCEYMQTMTCTGRRKDGSACAARALPGSQHCWAHDAGLRDKRDAARSKGGQAKSTAARMERLTPASLRPVLDQLLTAMESVGDGSVDPKIGSSLAALAGAVVRVYELSTLEQVAQDYQQRLEAMERGRSG